MKKQVTYQNKTYITIPIAHKKEENSKECCIFLYGHIHPCKMHRRRTERNDIKLTVIMEGWGWAQGEGG